MTIKKLSLAVFLVATSASVNAVDLGEFDGTRFSIGGYVKAEGVYKIPDKDDVQFAGSARQSRLNFSALREIEGHKVKGFIETDFWDNVNVKGDSTFGLRLRHAFISVDNLTLGQTWNGQFFASAPFDAEMLDFWGPGAGTIAGNGAVVRPKLVMHYVSDGLRLTLQDPVNADASHPDMVASYTVRTDSGHGFNLAMTGRDVATLNGDSEFGAALSLAAKFKLGQTSLSLTGFGGEGSAVYAGWGYNGPFGSRPMDVNAEGDLITTTGFSTGVTHKFSNKLRGTLRYGQDRAGEVAAGVADTLKVSTANLVYTYLPGLDFGLELRDQNATTLPSSVFAASAARDAGKQVEVMAMYKF